MYWTGDGDHYTSDFEASHYFNQVWVPLRDLPRQELLSIPVNQLEISIRLSIVFNGKWGDDPINTIGDLISKSEKQLSFRMHCGSKTMREIKEIVRYLGLSLSECRPAVPAAASPWFEAAF